MKARKKDIQRQDRWNAIHTKIVNMRFSERDFWKVAGLQKIAADRGVSVAAVIKGAIDDLLAAHEITASDPLGQDANQGGASAPAGITGQAGVGVPDHGQEAMTDAIDNGQSAHRNDSDHEEHNPSPADAPAGHLARMAGR